MSRKTVFAELPQPEQIDFGALARDWIDGRTDLIVVLGPTASGKTRYAVSLAEEINAAVALGYFEGCPFRMTDTPAITGAEIISADSRQVYRGMDIGTGKDLVEYNEVPYHLIDIAEAGSQYNVYQFQQDFIKAYAEHAANGFVLLAQVLVPELGDLLIGGLVVEHAGDTHEGEGLLLDDFVFHGVTAFRC